MNLEDIKSRIDKLNRYYEFLSSLRGSVSALDRDVLLMQLREFYEAVLYAEMSKKVEPVQKVEATVPKEKSQIVFSKEEQVEKKHLLTLTATDSHIVAKKTNMKILTEMEL